MKKELQVLEATVKSCSKRKYCTTFVFNSASVSFFPNFSLTIQIDLTKPVKKITLLCQIASIQSLIQSKQTNYCIVEFFIFNTILEPYMISIELPIYDVFDRFSKQNLFHITIKPYGK